MKRYFGLLYWGLAVIIMSLILMSATGSLGSSFFLSLMLLPGILLVKYYAGTISFKNRRQGILHSVYLGAIALLTEYLAIIFFYWFSYGFDIPEEPEMILNPVFIWFLLGSLLSIETLLKIKSTPEKDPQKYVRFISERVKVSLETGSIRYIESKDYEVLVWTGERSYPTRMKISQWESVLGEGFIRVHRSFLVNRTHIGRFDSRAVYLGEFPVEISRKYRESVLDKLEN